MGVAPIRHEFGSRAELAAALSALVAGALSDAIATRGTGLLAVSGGATPAAFFAELSKADIDWSKVVVTLVDERFVEPTSPRSNQGLVETTLLRGPASAARFVPLYHPAATVDDAAAQAHDAIENLPWPLDVAVLGMGADGHTASFFPDAIDLVTLIDPKSDHLVMPVHAASAGEPRLTLTMKQIIGAGLLVLHIEGAEKKALLDSALGDGVRTPIRSVIDHAPVAVEIYWAA